MAQVVGGTRSWFWLVVLAILVGGLVGASNLWAQEGVAPEETPEVAPTSLEPVPPGEELALVEQVVELRQEYEEALVRLVAYYERIGSDLKLRQAQDELEDFRKATRYDYVVLVDVLGPRKAARPIPQADTLFRDAMTYKNRPADLFFFGKKENLEEALRKFEELITQYPESDKVGEAAYRMGEIYEGPSFNEFLKAAKYYEAAFRWDPRLLYPARWKAAQIYDNRLADYTEARRLYELSANEDPLPDIRDRARKRVLELQTRGY